jgi:hypothetical protein
LILKIIRFISVVVVVPFIVEILNVKKLFASKLFPCRYKYSINEQKNLNKEEE